MISRILTGLLLSGLLHGALAADPMTIRLTLEPDLRNGQRLYTICASCHLPEGWGSNDGAYPQIAGQHRQVLFEQLLRIRSGERDNPAMYPFVQERTLGRGYQPLVDLVSYISRLPMHPRHQKGPWRDHRDEFREGEQIYQKHCAQCHGKLGEGNNDAAIPMLRGQHYPYLIRQVGLIRSGLRQVNPVMNAIIGSLDDAQVEKVINYVSWLPVPKDKLAPSLDWRNTDFN
jgi:cytochrome c553